jgi:hypothetical protein
MSALVKYGLEYEATSFERKLVEDGGAMGGFMYEVNEWRGIYRWEN